MPGNAFIKFADVPTGESLQVGFEGSSGWIEIGDWGWDVESDTNFEKGGGASVGKAKSGAVTFSHYYDKSSPVILKRIVQGKHFATIEIAMAKQTGADTPQRFFTLMCKEAFITKVSNKGGEDGAVNQDVEFVAKDLEIKYKPQKNSDGSLEAEITFGYNVAENKAR